jgi:hypothetical protein
MRVINRQKLFTAMAHFSLGRKEIFGCRLISCFGIAGYIAERMDRASAGLSSSDQATAFEWRGFSGMRKDLIKLFMT